jgi:hypothetical protein
MIRPFTSRAGPLNCKGVLLCVDAEHDLSRKRTESVILSSADKPTAHTIRRICKIQIWYGVLALAVPSLWCEVPEVPVNPVGRYVVVGKFDRVHIVM